MHFNFVSRRKSFAFVLKNQSVRSLLYQVGQIEIPGAFQVFFTKDIVGFFLEESEGAIVPLASGTDRNI